MKPLFPSNKALLESLLKKVEELEKKHNRSFEDLFLEAENSLSWTEEQEEIFHLHRKIRVCQTLIKRYENGK